jgi:hypothetical protein
MTSAPVLSVTTTGSGPESGAHISPASFGPASPDARRSCQACLARGRIVMKIGHNSSIAQMGHFELRSALLS